MSISHKFEEIENLAKPLMSLLEDRKKWTSHRQDIIDQFKLLKNKLKQLYNKYKSNKGTESISEDEEIIFIPFLVDAYTGMKTRIGDSPSDKMLSDVYDVLDYLSYWKGQI